MSELQLLIEATRKALYSRDQQLVDEVITAYTKILMVLESAAEKLDLDDTWGVYRLESLIQQAQDELDKYRDTLSTTIDRHTTGAIRDGHASALKMVQAQLWDDTVMAGAFNRLPVQAIETMFAMTRSGPLAQLLATFGPDIGEAMRNELVSGIARGFNPRTVARNMVKSFGIGANRADNIARTEMIRAYRFSQKRVYQDNEDIMEGWVWHSALDERTCVLCTSQHGSVHPLDEDMPSHPRCRCMAVPLTKTWESLGFTGIPETRIQTETGRDWFARQSPDKQRSILGPSAFDAYTAGLLDITDLAGIKHNATWGDSIYRKPLSEVIGGSQLSN